jgi:hypothetical protein
MFISSKADLTLLNADSADSLIVIIIIIKF